MARCAILAVATQPGPVEFLLPALTHALRVLDEADVVLACDPAWLPDAAQHERSGVRFVALPPPGAVGNLVNRLKPATLVVSTAGSPVEIAALAAGTGTGARCVQVVEVPYNHALRIRDSAPAGFEADLVVTVSSADADALAEAGIPRTRVSVVGHPGWERVAPEPAKNPAGAVFLSQPILDDGFDRFGYSEVTAWNLVLEARCRHPDRFESLVWAPHPRERRLDPLPDGCDAIAADTPSALRENGVAFGIFSSILTTAYLTGRHVISVQPELPENDFCALSRMGWIHRCASVDDILEALDARVEDAGDTLRTQMRGSAQRLASADISGADAFVKVNADCPLVDPEIVRKVVLAFRDGDAIDLATNKLDGSYPLGFSVEVVRVATLRRCDEAFRDPARRELVIQWMIDHPDDFRLLSISGPGHDIPYDLTVDEPHDYELMQRIFDALYKPGETFGLEAVLRFLGGREDDADRGS